jgi:predicted O-methyltransferase YrrM
MNYIEVNYQTWEREECYGMFDYSEIKDIRKHEKLVIKSTGILLRNSVTYDLVFVDAKAKNSKVAVENCLPFLKI